jgi:hypothetical protein
MDVELPERMNQEVREGQSGEPGVDQEQGQGQGVDMGRLMNSIEITKVSPSTSAPIFGW